MIDEAAEDARMMEEARFLGMLAESDLQETYVQIVALTHYDPAAWWTTH